MKNFLSFVCSFFIFLTSSATHNRAGEILYKRVAPFTNVVNSVTVQVYTYSITIIKYTDHSLLVADRCVDTIYFGDGQKGIANRINGTFTCNCNGNGCGGIIISSPAYTVKKNIYTITHTYTAPGTYTLRSSDPNRNGGVHNIPNSSNVPFVLESIIIISSITGANSSPVLSYAPIDQATLNACFEHYSGAMDEDGDSLSYEITPCLAIGYFNPEGTYSINPTTGLLSWCSPQFLDEYNVAFIVKEWRKNTSGSYQLNGQIMRDMQILVKHGVVGLTEKNWSNDLYIFPNPVSSELQINLRNQSINKPECLITDINGKTVFYQKETSDPKEIKYDISHLSPGMYTLRLDIDGRVLYKKIVKD